MNEQTPPAARVVHVHKDDFDVYIGRRMSRFPELKATGWGNPFKPAPGIDAIAKYREWIRQQPQLLTRLPELRSMRLGCWCAPEGGLPGNLEGTTCHGEILAALADALPSAAAPTKPVRTPRELAKWFIRDYVKRGDSLESLRRGQMGHFGAGINIRIRGIHIQVLDEAWNVVAQFTLASIYREIQEEIRTARAGVLQASLFDGLLLETTDGGA